MTTPLIATALLLAAPAQAADEDDARKAWDIARPWGQLQVWVTPLDQDVSDQANPASYGDPEADPGFAVRRARFGFHGELPAGEDSDHEVDYGVSVGVAAPYDALSPVDEDVQIVDAWGRWRLPYGRFATSVTAGQDKVPVSREALMASRDLVFQERAVATEWLTPGREVGAILGQTIDLTDSGNVALMARGGLFNGNGALFGDDDPGLMGVARLDFSYGDTYRTWSQDLENAAGVGVSYLSNTRLATSEQIVHADLIGRFKWVTLMGEFTQRSITPTSTTIAPPAVQADTDQLGLTGQLSVFVPAGKGGVEVAGRIGTLDDATQFEDSGDVWLLHGGLTWRNAVPFADIGAGWIHRGERPDAEITNDTLRIWLQVRS